MENGHEYHEDGGGDFYESFELELEEDKITAGEEGFMVGFVGLEED